MLRRVQDVNINVFDSFADDSLCTPHFVWVIRKGLGIYIIGSQNCL